MKKHMDTVLLAKVDVDEMEELAMQLNVSLIDQLPASTHLDRSFYAIWEERQLTWEGGSSHTLLTAHVSAN